MVEQGSINPTTEELLGKFSLYDKKAVNNAVKLASKTFPSWAKTDLSDRVRIISKMIDKIKFYKKELSTLITKEMGKPLSESEGEVDATIGDMTWFLNEGKKFIETESVDLGNNAAEITFEPLGVVGAISAWNFPLNNPMYKIIPALICGDTVVWKPSELTSITGMRIFDIFKEISLPEGALNLILGDGTTGRYLVDSKINMVSLTGSSETGKNVMKRAGKGLKKVVLELGGNDPFIVCGDVDLDKVIRGAVRGRFYNCGQVCSADKRFYVEKKIAEEFIQKFTEQTASLQVGNPLDATVDIGPLVSQQQREKLETQINSSVTRGAKILCGGKRPKNINRGYFYLPTVLADVNHTMRVMREETFGPVASIMPVKDIEQAIKLANDTRFGLAASIWSKDEAKAKEISKSLNVGTVWINKSGAFYDQMPWGGVKESGIGREFSKYGMWEFVNIKSTI